MRNRHSIFIGLAAVAIAIGCATAGDISTESWKLPAETARFKPAPGAALVTASCTVCHSADYIAIQPPMDREQWTGLVNKMRAKFGAPIMTDKVDEIADYLFKNYGRE